jgi:hypothetical protein
MTLQEIKDKIEFICLQHKSIKSFDFGKEFDVIGDIKHEYPKAFLEIPYALTYFPEQQQFKGINFALLFLFNPKQDNLREQHEGISNADQIADSIIARLQNELYGKVLFESISSISLSEYTAEDLSGVRVEFIGRMQRETNSNVNCYENNFKDLSQ